MTIVLVYKNNNEDAIVVLSVLQFDVTMLSCACYGVDILLGVEVHVHRG